MLPLFANLDHHPNLTSGVIFGLGWFYLLIFAMNLFWTVRSTKKDGHVHWGKTELPISALWSLYSAMLLMVAIAHFTGHKNPDSFLIRLPEWFKLFVDSLIGNPISFTIITLIMFWAMLAFRAFWVKPTVGWCLLNGSLLFLTLSMTDYDFRKIVGKPDNVPIVGMLFLVGYFTWLYFARAVENDTRLEEGRPLLEQENNGKVLVWPDLVYTELICMVLLTALLIFWGVALQAPLEEPANAAKTPNPSKAPWYFLGLQEMLVYFDPWMAGVVLPSIMLVGLMAIPYIDFNKKGNGYYCYKDRKMAVQIFLFGFLPLWIALIILGTFLRGPNWNIFGIYEYWDVHKLEVLNNVNLSEYFWVYGLNQGLPTPDPQSSKVVQAMVILKREIAGVILVGGFLVVLPGLLTVTCFRNIAYRMGFLRYSVFITLVLFMVSLPAKMILRWAFSLKYIIAIPEWFFNI